MTRFTVVWTQRASDQLAQLWLDSNKRDEVTVAADAIDKQLRDDPDHKGSVASEKVRELFEPPLRVLFSIREPDRIVEVIRIALLDKR